MGYVDLSTLHTPIGGARPPAAYGRQIEANFDHLAGPPRCILGRTTTQAIPNNAWTAALWPNEALDSALLHSTLTNTGRVTVPTGLGGTWEFKANITFDGDATGIRGVGIRKNGADPDPPTHGFVYKPNNGGSNAWADDFCREVVLVAGDWVEVVVFQNSGGDLDLVDVVSPASWGGLSMSARMVAI